MKISRLNWLSWSNMLIVSGNVCCTSWQYPWKSFRVHIHKAEIYSILSPYNSVSSLFCQCAVRVFSLQEVPLWSYEKSVWAGAQMNSPEWQTAADQHGPHWDVRGNLLETIISAIFHFNKVLTRSLFFCRHCPPLTSESPWQIFHRAVENVNELFAPSNGSKWRMVRMRDQVHIEVHLWTQTAIGRIGIHMTWPILDSYFILWDKESEQNGGSNDERLSKMHPWGQGCLPLLIRDQLFTFLRNVSHFCRHLMWNQRGWMLCCSTSWIKATHES